MVGIDANISDDEDDAASDMTIVFPNVSSLDIHSIANRDIVQLNHVDGLTIYVHSIRKDEMFCDMLTKINSTEHHSKAIGPEENDVVLVKHSGDFTRAEIMKVDAMHITVKLIDFGKVINVKEVWEIPSPIMAYECMVLPLTLDLPGNLSNHESSAVENYLKKLLHNRFQIVAKEVGNLNPHQIVDLINITNGNSTVQLLSNYYEKRFFNIKNKRLSGTAFWIVENKNLENGIISCTELNDRPIFLQRCSDLNTRGDKELKHAEAYLPGKSELCLANILDDDGVSMWYRCQYQQTLTNNRAQVGLIDFGVSAIANIANIRKWCTDFDYDCLTIVCKLQATDSISIDLLDHTALNIFSSINADRLRKLGTIYEMFLGEGFFVQDENNEEQELVMLDLFA